MKSSLFTAVLTLLLCLSGAVANTYTVLNTNNAGAGSLREAINLAEANPGPDTVNFGALFATPQTITLASSLSITTEITLDGPAAPNQVSISGNDLVRVFKIESTGTGAILFRNLKICNGLAISGSDDEGGGVYIDASSMNIAMEGCQIFDNRGDYRGGGMYLTGGTLTLTGCLVENNRSDYYGGGMYLRTSATIETCTIRGNTSHWTGGGITSDAPLTIRNSTISGNTTEDSGGGISGRDLQMINSTVSGNEADADGGGVQIRGGTSRFTNCTITKNATLESFGSGGGIATYGSSTVVELLNTIVAENEDTVASDPTAPDVYGDFVSLGHNLIGNRQGSTGFLNGVLGDRVGNVNDPLNPKLLALAQNGATESHTPKAESPAIDGGDLTAVSSPTFAGPPFFDQAGQPRNVGLSVDIGAVEKQGVLTVTNANNSGTGSLRAAIQTANATTEREVIVFSQDVDWAANPILLTNSLSLTAGVVIEGPASWVEIRQTTAGQRVMDVNMTLAGEALLRRLALTNGQITGDGGGLRVLTNNSTLQMETCSLQGNTASSRGGGVFVDDGKLVMIDCSVNGNQATGNGGGISTINNAILEITNATLSTNASNNNGGGIAASDTVAMLTNVTLTANRADDDNTGGGNGGGIWSNTTTNDLKIANTIIAKNFDDSTTGTIHPDVSGPFVTLGYNFIGTSDGLGVGDVPFANGVLGDQVGTGVGINPQFGPQANGPGLFNVFHRINAGSTAIDAGQSSMVTEPPFLDTGAHILDQRGQWRIVGAAVDIGAFESPVGMIATVDTDDSASEFERRHGVFEFSRSLASAAQTVTFSVTGTATRNVDYTMERVDTGEVFALSGGNGQVDFAAGVSSVKVRVKPVDDNSVEGTETVIVTLTSGAGYTIDSGFATSTMNLLDSDFVVANNNQANVVGSLRRALADADAAGGGVIAFDSGLGGFFTVPRTIAINSTLQINSSVTIDALSTPGVTINGGGVISGPSISIVGSAVVMIKGLTVQGTPAGAGIYAPSSTLTLDQCQIQNNSSPAGVFGGGVFAGTLYLIDSTVSGNICDRGGGLYVSRSLNAINSTIVGNSARFDGGGIYCMAVSGKLIHCTITGNTSDSDSNNTGSGGGIFCFGGLYLGNTVVALNVDNGALVKHDLSGFYYSLGGNFIARSTGSGLVNGVNDDQVGTNAAPLSPQLGILQNNGGRTDTRLPAGGSPLINAGKNAIVNVNNFGLPPFHDQRQGTRVVGVAVDIGAVEQVGSGVEILAVDDQARETGAGPAVFRISRGTAAVSSLVVNLQFSSGTTISANDGNFSGGSYSFSAPNNATVTIPANQSFVDLTFTPTDDSTVESTETIILAVQPGTYIVSAVFASTTATVTDDDFAVTNTNNTGAGSLRSAVGLANAADGGVIRFQLPAGLPPGSPPQTINLVSEIDITAPVTIEGPTTSAVVIRGGNATRLFEIIDTGATMRNLTLSSGTIVGYGGLVFAHGDGTSVFENCTFTDGQATWGGAVSLSQAARANFLNCTISGNRSTRDGGGLYWAGGYSFGLHCTITNNTADSDADNTGLGGGIASSVSSSVAYVILAGNAAAGAQNDDGYAPPGTTVMLSSVLGGDPRLGPLAYNGGPTSTHALLCDSPAIDLVTPAPLLTLNTDQRGEARSKDGNFDGITRHDAGAFEAQTLTWTQWREANFNPVQLLNNSVSGYTADANGTGYANLLKYFHRIPPLGAVTAADRAALPTASYVDVSGIRKVRITYRRRFGVTGITAEYRSSNDLASWTVQSASSETTIACDPVTGDPIIQAEFILPANTPKKFYQIRLNTIP